MHGRQWNIFFSFPLKIVLITHPCPNPNKYSSYPFPKQGRVPVESFIWWLVHLCGGEKAAEKKIKTLAKLLKTRSMSTSLLHLLRKWTSSEETWSRWPHINRPSSPPLKAFRTELFCDQLGKVFKYPAYLYTDGFLSIRPPAQSVIDRICA